MPYILSTYLSYNCVPFDLLPPISPPSNSGNHKSDFYEFGCFLLFFFFLWDSTYKWSDIVFVLLWLISLSIMPSRSTNPIYQIFLCNQFRFPDIFWTREYINLTLSSCVLFSWTRHFGSGFHRTVAQRAQLYHSDFWKYKNWSSVCQKVFEKLREW